MNNKEQMEKWARGELAGKGKAAHVFRKVGRFPIEECCPDFSCCKPELLAPIRLREEFLKNPASRDKMLMGFLGAMLAAAPPGKKPTKVYLTDGSGT
jgi:hypothetical protein